MCFKSALNLAVLPRAPELEKKRSCTDAAEPGPHGSVGELGPMVGAEARGDAVRNEHVRQTLEYVGGPDVASPLDGQALPGVFVHHRKAAS